jgi:hypothetical protein
MDDVQTRQLLRQIAEALGCDRHNILNTIAKLKENQSDTEWLKKSQELIVNTRWLINHGKTETADQTIEQYWINWRKQCEEERKIIISQLRNKVVAKMGNRNEY